MAEAKQYSFGLRELAAALLKTQGIREGQWALEMEFSHASFYAGPSPEKARQAIGISVHGARITKVENSSDYPPGLIFDAAALDASAQTPGVEVASKPRRAPRSRVRPEG